MEGVTQKGREGKSTTRPCDSGGESRTQESVQQGEPQAQKGGKDDEYERL